MKHLLKDKKFMSIYLLWTLIHTFLLFQSSKDRYYNKEFWPFCDNSFDITYDKSEWLVYVFAPLAIIFLISSFTDKIIKVIVIGLLSSTALMAQTPELLPVVPNQSDLSTGTISHENTYTDTYNDPSLNIPKAKKIKRNKIEEEVFTELKQSPNNSPTYYNQIDNDLEPRRFNWDAVNADRFVNSPCYRLLGFDPFGDLQMQENRYRKCEQEKQLESLKKWSLILFVILIAIFLVYKGISASRQNIIK